MKKLLIWLVCVMMLVCVSACGDEAGTDLPGTPDATESTSGTDDQGNATDPTGQNDATTTTTTKKGDATKSTGSTTEPKNNEVDYQQFFGDDTTTTTTKKGDTTKKPTSSSATSTTSTTKPTTTTTLKPTTIDQVSLPAVGTDVDGKGRIAVSKVELSSGVMTLKLRNNTDKQTQKWITEETNYVTYACYDKDGKVLKGSDDVFGYFYLGCLEAGDEIEFKVTLPAGTTRVELTGAKIVYWTPWS